jgi:hypothetical protein
MLQSGVSRVGCSAGGSVRKQRQDQRWIASSVLRMSRAYFSKSGAFHGTECLDIDIQVQISGGLLAFTIVGLPDKALGESRERMRAAFNALPARGGPPVPLRSDAEFQQGQSGQGRSITRVNWN